MTAPNYKTHESVVMSQLQDDDYAVAYLNAAIEEANPRSLLIALRRIADAKGIGMTRLAQSAHLQREGLYKILSEQGNPEYLTFCSLLNALGFELSIRKKAS